MKFIKSKTVVVNEFDPSQFVIGEGYAIKHRDQKGYTCGILTAATTGEVTFAVYCTKSISALVIRIDDMDMFEISKLISEDFISDTKTGIVEEPVVVEEVKPVEEPVVVQADETEQAVVEKTVEESNTENSAFDIMKNWLLEKGDEYLATRSSQIIINDFHETHPGVHFNQYTLPKVLNEIGPLKGEVFKEFIPDLLKVSNCGRALEFRNGTWKLATVCASNKDNRLHKMFKYRNPDSKKYETTSVANAVLTVFRDTKNKENKYPVYKNGNHLDCRLDNLEWGVYSRATKAAKETKKETKKPEKKSKKPSSSVTVKRDPDVIRLKVKNFINSKNDEYLIMKTHSELIDEFNSLYPKLTINKSIGNRKIFDEVYDSREIYGEKFVDIERFNGTEHDYQISNLGRVRTKQNGKWHILAPSRGNNGIRAVQPSKDVKIVIARTVLIAFGPKPVPLHGVPIFKNGDRFDCRIDNLGWSTTPLKDHSGTFNFNNDADAEILKQNLFDLLCKSEDLEMCLDLFKKKYDASMLLNTDELRIPVIEVSKNYKHPAEIQREVSIRYGAFVPDEIIIETLSNKKLMQLA